MPITEELNNVKEFESVGFSHDQAEKLAFVIEKSHAQSQENLKEFIRNEINGLRNDIKNEIRFEIKDLETRLMVSQKDLLIKIFGIIVGTVGIAFTLLKLF